MSRQSELREQYGIRSLTDEQIAARAIKAENKRREKEAPLLVATGVLERVGDDYGSRHVENREIQVKNFEDHLLENGIKEKAKADWYREKVSSALKSALLSDEFAKLDDYANSTFWIIRDQGYRASFWGEKAEKLGVISKVEHHVVAQFGPEGLDDEAAVRTASELVRVFETDFTPTIKQQVLDLIKNGY